MLDLTESSNIEHQFKSYTSDLPTTGQSNTTDTFTVNGTRYSVSQVKSINWRSGGSWQSWVLADVWHVNFSNGTSLSVVPTQLDNDSWDILSNLAFPDSVAT